MSGCPFPLSQRFSGWPCCCPSGSAPLVSACSVDVAQRRMDLRSQSQHQPVVGTLAHSLEWTLDPVDQSLITVVGLRARASCPLQPVCAIACGSFALKRGAPACVGQCGDQCPGRCDSGFWLAGASPRPTLPTGDYFLAFKERGHGACQAGRCLPHFRDVAALSARLSAPQASLAALCWARCGWAYAQRTVCAPRWIWVENSGVNLFRNDGVIVSHSLW